MARVVLLLVFLFSFSVNGIAQNEKWDNYHYVDSVISNQIYFGKTDDLIKSTANAIEAGTKYPKLFTYRGYAFLNKNKPHLASTNYLKALQLNRSNTDAQQGWYLSNLELNQPERAAWFHYQQGLNDSSSNAHKNNFRAITDFGLDYSFKAPQDDNRENANYLALTLKTRLTNRLYLSQQVAFFKQKVSTPEASYDYDRRGNPILPYVYETTEKKIKQSQYFAKLNYVLLPNIQLYSSLQSIRLNINETILKGYAMTAGITGYAKNFILSANYSNGKLYSNAIQQYHFQTSWYPFNNLSFYSTAGFTILNYNSSNQNLPDISLGFKVSKKIWLESSLIYGNYSNLLFADGSLWFNTLDQGIFRSGFSGIFKINNHFNLSAHYHLDKFDNLYQNQLNKYYQHSITTSLTWKP
jgi:hypothetical protein